jgi:hypothetical protein
MLFTGKIKGVQLYESAMFKSTLRLEGHANDRACTITVEIALDDIKSLAAQYGVDGADIRIEIGGAG